MQHYDRCWQDQQHTILDILQNADSRKGTVLCLNYLRAVGTSEDGSALIDIDIKS